jgi:hypothetical protein
MHKDVWRYIELETKLNDPSFVSRLMLLGQLVMQPLGHIIFWISFFWFPSVLVYFGYQEVPSFSKLAFYIFGSIQTCYAMFEGWSNMVEFYNLGTLFLVAHIKLCRLPNPFIVRSSNRAHQLFRYASLLEYVR